MAKIINLISDIELRLSKGNVSDDFQIDRRQIRHWLDVVRTAMIREADDKGGVSQALEDYLKLYECNLIEEELKGCDDGCDNLRYTVTLPSRVASLKNDLGVYRVETQGGETVKRMRLSEVSRFKHLKYGRPSNVNISWYRVDDKLFIQGGTDNFKKNGKINLYLVLEDSSDLSDDDEFPVDHSLIAPILDRVEAIGRRQLEMIEDEANDGKQA